MDIQIIASGSSGNCYIVRDGRYRLMIECGIPIAKIKQACGYRLTEFSGCLVSHSHGDHARTARELLRAGVDVYASQETVKAIGTDHHRLHEVRPDEPFSVGCFDVWARPVEHDAPGTIAFWVSNGKERLFYVTDTRFCRIPDGVTHLMIEANYSDALMLDNVALGLIPVEQGKRTIENHMSIETLLKILDDTDTSSLQHVYLLHMSAYNADQDDFKRRVQQATGAEVHIS